MKKRSELKMEITEWGDVYWMEGERDVWRYSADGKKIVWCHNNHHWRVCTDREWEEGR